MAHLYVVVMLMTMQRFATDERTDIQYELIGDYYYPCLMIEQPPTLSKYGRLRAKYLREHKKVLYFNLLTRGKRTVILTDSSFSFSASIHEVIKL